uniref:Heme peroxidase n=1 Tax=Heterorhabditis bacteriophora TaxID=37862 RepID=A0A1I7XR72_HETBA
MMQAQKAKVDAQLEQIRGDLLMETTKGATPGFDYNTNHFYMQFGQWIAHDIIHMPSSVGPKGENLDCSSCNSSFITDNCSPIFIPADDEYFPSKENDIEKCMRFTRALNAQDILGERIQINQNTHYLDLSVVYGSDNCEAALVRSFKNGELKTFDNGYVLPPQAKQETRRVNIAQYQHHVYSEYLPKVLGDPLMRQFNLKPRTKGYHTRYSTSIEATLSVEFAAAAFRFGHSQVRKNLPRKMAGLKKVDTFDELKNDSSIDDANVEALKKVYADVNDIDLYTGIMLEKANEGGSVRSHHNNICYLKWYNIYFIISFQIGRTGGFIIAEQFSALKRGDRFFYENMVRRTRGLLHDELKAIRQTTLSKVICENSKQTKIIGKNIFSV